MRGFVITVGLMACGLVACVGAPAAQPSASSLVRGCGAVLGEGTPTNISARNVLCATAKRVARKATLTPSYGGCGVARGNRVVLRQPCRILGFRCRTLGAADTFHSFNECSASGGRWIRFVQG